MDNLLKIGGGAISFGLFFFIIFHYLTSENEVAKQNLQITKQQTRVDNLEHDREMIMSKYYLALDFGKKKEAEYYLKLAEEKGIKLEKVNKEIEDSKNKLKKVQQETEKILKDNADTYKDLTKEQKRKALLENDAELIVGGQ